MITYKFSPNCWINMDKRSMTACFPEDLPGPVWLFGRSGWTQPWELERDNVSAWKVGAKQLEGLCVATFSIPTNQADGLKHTPTDRQEKEWAEEKGKRRRERGSTAHQRTKLGYQRPRSGWTAAALTRTAWRGRAAPSLSTRLRLHSSPSLLPVWVMINYTHCGL